MAGFISACASFGVLKWETDSQYPEARRDKNKCFRITVCIISIYSKAWNDGIMEVQKMLKTGFRKIEYDGCYAAYGYCLEINAYDGR